MTTLSLRTTRRIEALDITDRLVARRWPDGIALLSAPHTTAALILGEADPEMLHDYEQVAAAMFAPWEPYRHHRNDNPNAQAHLLSSFAGTQLLVPCRGERLLLGTFQRIIFLELDGPKPRTVEFASLMAQPLED